MGGSNGIYIFLSGTVFGPYRIFLIELSQIINIIHIISDGVGAIRSLKGWWQPQGSETQFCQAGRFFFYFSPQTSVVWIIPMKELEYRSILHSFNHCQNSTINN